MQFSSFNCLTAGDCEQSPQSLRAQVWRETRDHAVEREHVRTVFARIHPQQLNCGGVYA